MLLTICESRSTNLSLAQLCWHIQCRPRALHWVSSEAGAARGARISSRWQPQTGTGSDGRSRAGVPQMQIIGWAGRASTCCSLCQTELAPLTLHVPIKHALYHDLKNMVQLYIILAVTASYLCHKDNRRPPLQQRLVKKQRKFPSFIN